MTTLLDEKEVIARCAAAGIQWLAPQVSDQHGPLVGVFSGAFMANMQKLLSEALRTPSAAGVVSAREWLNSTDFKASSEWTQFALCEAYDAGLAAAPIAQAAAPADLAVAELQNIVNAEIKNFVATNPYHEFFLWAQSRARHTLAQIGAATTCATCNGNGMIGGPSYSAPDEGGEPCPDCAAPAAPQTAKQYIATLPADWHKDSSLETWFPLTAQELASTHRMFLAACSDLGLISEALCLDPDDGGAEPILDAIEELKAKIPAVPAEQGGETGAQSNERLISAVGLMQRLKRDLMHARRFGTDTLAAYRRACSSAEGDVEEWLIENATPAPHSGEAGPIREQIGMSIEQRLSDAEADRDRLHKEKMDLWMQLRGYGTSIGEAGGVVAEPVDENEHPAARRMRLEFNAKYGDMATAMRAINAYMHVVEKFRSDYNHLSDERVTNADLDTAEALLLSKLRALFAAQPQAAPSGLSEVQIEKGWHDTFNTSNPFCPCDLKSFTKAVRWVERVLVAAQQANGSA